MSSIHELAWIILFSPLIACLLITLLTLRWSRLSSLIAVFGLLISFALSCIIFFFASKETTWTSMEISIPWINLWTLQVEFGLILDHLSILMLLVVTGIGSAIFIYSIGYMRNDPGKSRYFACLSLFAFSMLGIVLSNNFIQMFIFWELVGVSSYLLIGFWYEKDSAADAGNKAFLVNRVGDLGFILGILMCWIHCNAGAAQRTFNFFKIENIVPNLIHSGFLSPAILAVIGLLIFCGVVGKSAQFPLHVWLPDAMEGPTPVSALIHAATMVAAGIYLLARLFFLFDSSVEAMAIIAGIGALTSIFSAIIAIVQNDIKRILAYSTLSQLGLMVMAMGLGAKTAALYHLTTHAFFKALLFLGAGSVIHVLHTQNIWQMGRLFKKMPITTITFIIGAMALCGIFPLSGFWSKDEILIIALGKNVFLFWIAAASIWMTSLYTSRLVFVAFLGKDRTNGNFRESGWLMTLPLIALTIGSVMGGFLGIPAFLSPSIHPEELLPTWDVAIFSQSLTLLGIVLSYFIYAYKGVMRADFVKAKCTHLYKLLIRKFYIDELYDWLVQRIQQTIAVICALFDRYFIIRTCVNGTAWTVRFFGELLRLCQTGRVQTYALFFFAGVMILIFAFILR